MTLYLSALIGSKEDVIAKAFSYPNMHPKKKPTSDVAAKAVLNVVETTVHDFMVEELREPMQDAYDMYVLVNGERSDSDDPDDWDSGIDDQVEEMLEPYQEHLSADWLGRYTINTRLDEENGVDKFLKALGKEVFKQLSDGKTPAQALSNAGIVTEDINAALAAHLEGNAPVVMDNPNINADLGDVLAAIRTRVGENFDPVAIYDDFGFIVGDDDGEPDDVLAASAASRLGIDENGVFTLQMAAMDMEDGIDKADKLCDLLTAAPVAAAKPKRSKAERQAAAPKGDVLPAAVLGNLKAHSGVGDTAMAQTLGVSRQQYNNYINGKSDLVLTDEQKQAVRDQYVADINGLITGLNLIEGNERYEKVA